MAKQYTAQQVLDIYMRGMGDFQIKNFVINAQLTPIKQLHQTAMEIEVREENIRKGEFEHKKNSLKIEIIKQKKSREEDPLLQAELDLDIVLLEEKLVNIAREQVRMEYELKSFYEVMDFFNQNFDIEELLNMKDTLEVDYWVRRLAKQAALDLVSSGRISNGNLSSMMDMPEEIFKACLQETFKITDQLGQLLPMTAALSKEEDKSLLKFSPDEATNDFNKNTTQ